jgi:MFS transporter, LPLT family, lysophospholipid transporter
MLGLDARCCATTESMPPRFGLLIGAQFASALADNALLIVAIALLEQQGLPGWWAPLLKVGFLLSYVLLAPFVGPLADAFPKARVMAAMNVVKVIGVLALLAGVHPVAALAVVGFGAAAYAPAKYGLVTELVSADDLVAANAWLEITVVCAVLLGTVLGGLLISPWVVTSGWSRQMQGWTSAEALTLSLLFVLALYALASGQNLGVPHSGARYPRCAPHLGDMLRDFGRANRALWRDVEGGLSLAATTILWGAGATLQFAVLRWAVDRLGFTLDHAAYLQAAVAVGVVAGASAAGRWVPLRHAKRVLAAGVLMGCLIPLAALLRNLTLVVLLLALIGFIGGFMIVPLNALLQHRGFTLLTAGRSIAVQGFNENLSVLAMLAVYAALLAMDVPIVVTLWLLGLFVAAAIGTLMLRERRRAGSFGFGGVRSRVR